MQEIKDRIELKNLVDVFANLADEKRVHDQMELFTPDAHVITYADGAIIVDAYGRDEIEKGFSDYIASAKALYHLNGQQSISEISSDKAKGICYSQATLLREIDGKTILQAIYARYQDSYIKIDGKWLIAERIATFMINENREFGK